jgi:hypothetical protein
VSRLVRSQRGRGWRVVLLVAGLDVTVWGLDGSPLRHLTLDPTVDSDRCRRPTCHGVSSPSKLLRRLAHAKMGFRSPPIASTTTTSRRRSSVGTCWSGQRGKARCPPGGTPSIPLCALSMASPGAGAVEAALVEVPIFLGWGERDVCQDPLREAAAFRRASDVTIFVCPRMCHMHNFASTRERFWSRIEAWGSGVASDLAHIDRKS